MGKLPITLLRKNKREGTGEMKGKARHAEMRKGYTINQYISALFALTKTTCAKINSFSGAHKEALLLI